MSDLVVYFLRLIFSLLRPDGFTAFITTNSIKDGDIRKDGLDQVLQQGGAINMAVRGIKWPGLANLVVSLVALHNGQWLGKPVLDGKEVSVISAYFDDNEDAGKPMLLAENANSVFQGSIFLGDGFLLTHDEADALILADERNQDVILPVINGQEINNQPDQTPQRKAINSYDWRMERAQQYVQPFERIQMLVKPVRDKDKMKSRREKWWQFGALVSGLYTNIRSNTSCLADIPHPCYPELAYKRT